jgi:hypothetical protein
MRNRHTSGKGTRTARGRKGDKPKATGALAPPTPQERLDYIAAMLRELRVMLADDERPTLAGLLDLAYREAVRRSGGR